MQFKIEKDNIFYALYGAPVTTVACNYNLELIIGNNDLLQLMLIKGNGKPQYFVID